MYDFVPMPMVEEALSCKAGAPPSIHPSTALNLLEKRPGKLALSPFHVSTRSQKSYLPYETPIFSSVILARKELPFPWPIDDRATPTLAEYRAYSPDSACSSHYVAGAAAPDTSRLSTTVVSPVSRVLHPPEGHQIGVWKHTYY